MAKIKKGIIGGFIGSIKELVGWTGDNKELIRGSKSKLADKSKVVKQKQVQRFRAGLGFYKIYGNDLRLVLTSIGLNNYNVNRRIQAGSAIAGLNQSIVGFDNVVLKISTDYHIKNSTSEFDPVSNVLRLRFDDIQQLNFSINNPKATAGIVVNGVIKNFTTSRNLKVNSVKWIQKFSNYNSGDRLLSFLCINDSTSNCISNLYLVSGIVP